jgi:hypothetical protein
MPYTLDAFSGKITPISDFSRHGATVTVHVRLARDDSTVIALSQQQDRFGAMPKSATPKIENVAAPIDLTKAAWHLDAEDWQPTNPYGTTGPAGTETTKVPVSVDLNGLAAWPDIPTLKNASGIGTYHTTFTLPQNWDSRNGAVLSLGQVTDSFDIAVNGHAVPADQISATADLGDYLHAGTNDLTVRVATTLNNRLYQLDSSVAARGLIQNYGLVGPVVLSPSG